MTDDKRVESAEAGWAEVESRTTPAKDRKPLFDKCDREADMRQAFDFFKPGQGDK